MIKVNYNETTGQILGFYPDDIEYTIIPTQYIEIDETTWQDCIDNLGNRIVDVTNLVIIKGTITVTLTTDEQIAALDAEYQPQFEALQLAWAAANISSNTALLTSITSDYAALKLEYQTKLEAIESGE